jgi:hypothetical protein
LSPDAAEGGEPTMESEFEREATWSKLLLIRFEERWRELNNTEVIDTQLVLSRSLPFYSF